MVLFVGIAGEESSRRITTIGNQGLIRKRENSKAAAAAPAERRDGATNAADQVG